MKEGYFKFDTDGSIKRCSTYSLLAEDGERMYPQGILKEQAERLADFLNDIEAYHKWSVVGDQITI